MANKTYFPDTLSLTKIDVAKIFLDKRESKSSTSIVYDRIPIKYQLGEDTNQVLTFELKTQGKINASILDGKEKNYTMILKTTKGMDEPSAVEQANIDKLEAIEDRIQNLVREQKVPLKTSKSSKTEKFLDPDDLIVLRRNKTPQGDQMNPVIFAKMYSENGEVALGDNFRKLNTKAEYIRTKGRCGIHSTAKPNNYLGGWMNLIAVVKVSVIFIGNVQNIQVRLVKVIIIDRVKKISLIDPSIEALMPEEDDEDDKDEDDKDEDDEKKKEEGSSSEEEEEEATINIIEV